MPEPAARGHARFRDRVVLVTGASRGIGRATATRFCQEGARTVLVAIDPDELARSVNTLIEQGFTATGIVGDVSNAEHVKRIVAEALSLFAKVDVLHNNAGRLRVGSVVDTEPEEWERTYAVNVRSMFLMCREVIPHMLVAGGGAIINTSSTSAIVGEAALAAYSSSKGAVTNLTRQLAADYSGRGIRINSVSPGWIPTGFNDPIFVGVPDEEVQATVERTVPMRRQGTTEEVAAAVAFLASDDASYITGHALVVDGGLTACR
jgi:meso-butanediol dehydrogenase/(S,S)-butanediol dehydrogenase/diacetyl reductase